MCSVCMCLFERECVCMCVCVSVCVCVSGSYGAVKKCYPWTQDKCNKATREGEIARFSVSIALWQHKHKDTRGFREMRWRRN